MQGSPVLDWCSSYLVPDPGIPPDMLAVGPYLAFVFSLSYECKASIFVVVLDQLRYCAEFADLAAPSGFHRGRTEIVYRLPERVA